jgi:hypothetical protein
MASRKKKSAVRRLAHFLRNDGRRCLALSGLRNRGLDRRTDERGQVQLCNRTADVPGMAPFPNQHWRHTAT